MCCRVRDTQSRRGGRAFVFRTERRQKPSKSDGRIEADTRTDNDNRSSDSGAFFLLLYSAGNALKTIKTIINIPLLT